MTTVLVVEDNRTLAFGLSHHLERDGFEVAVAYTGEGALRAARRLRPDLIVLDFMLPDIDGLEVLRILRAEGMPSPVLMLTARSGEEDVVRAFVVGVDDYVRKPFRIREVLARIRALLRRAQGAPPAEAPEAPPPPAPITFGSVEIRPDSCTVLRDGQPVDLRPKEYDLLLALASRGGNVASRADLLREVWGYAPAMQSRTLDTHVLELRRKLESNPNEPAFLLTVRTRGYRLRVDAGA